MTKKIKVTQIGSPIRRPAYQKQNLIGLGLGRMHRSRVLDETPMVAGMIRKVRHLITVEYL